EWTKDESGHWHEATCEHKDTLGKKDFAAHTWNDNHVCSVCGRTETHTVTFTDYDGTVLDTRTVEYGMAATTSATPTRSGYTFKGWDKTLTSITEDTVVTATYHQDSPATQTDLQNPTFVIDTVTAKPGDTNVAVTISVVNNPGICSIFVSPHFDKSALTLTGWEFNDAKLGGQTTPFKEDVASPKLTWTNYCTKPITGDFVYATLYFTVSGTASGTIPISLTYNAGDVYDLYEQNVTFDIANGGITVSAQ
ncbi:MAG: InlB B-repeat-containing protein, partial [Ruminococcus sp.]|nr:InlB B-repeat-containing protein [Candidatus Apopatosoma intestinale]